MRNLTSRLTAASVVGALSLAPTVLAQAPARTAAPTATVVCSSGLDARQHCAADTSAGVLLLRETGEAACLLGRTWGYDATGVWVTEGCGGEFLVAATAPEPEPAVEMKAAAAPVRTRRRQSPRPPRLRRHRVLQSPTNRANASRAGGSSMPGTGFLVGRSNAGELSISAYALFRYIDQLPADETFTDHLGNEHPVDTRQDMFPHRIMVFLKGWVGTPKLIYTISSGP